jgi:hypothetical protein
MSEALAEPTYQSATTTAVRMTLEVTFLRPGKSVLTPTRFLTAAINPTVIVVRDIFAKLVGLFL